MALPSPAPDRTCIVTGASSGIGERIARQLAGRGLGVTLVARREDRLRALADELGGTGVRAEVVAADLADDASRRRLADTVTERGLTVDVLVNNAGFSTTGPVHRSDPDREVTMLRTDVEAVAHLCSLFLPRRRQPRRGHRRPSGAPTATRAAAGEAAPRTEVTGLPRGRLVDHG